MSQEMTGLGKLKGSEQGQFHSGLEHWLWSQTDLGLTPAPLTTSSVVLDVSFHFFGSPFPGLYHGVIIPACMVVVSIK